ncbi:hypothetical protein ACWD7F_28190 [Streptomyces sp. NPDC005122]
MRSGWTSRARCGEGSWGLVAGADKAVPADLERFFHRRPGTRGVVEVPGASHVAIVAMTSHPGITARLIEDAARATG